MEHSLTALTLVMKAARKVDFKTSSWKNVIAFIRSCYAGRVGDYDFDDAIRSLTLLTDDEQHALIAWVLMLEEFRQVPC